MRTKEIQIFVYEFDKVSELPKDEQELVNKAREATKSAYAPYSGFSVGAAIKLENGKIIKGNNQENAAFPTGLCAERVALFYANANYPEFSVETIAITAAKDDIIVEGPVRPCGSCRQALSEAEVRFKKPIKIILDGLKKIQVLESVDSLLPFAFKRESLD